MLSTKYSWILLLICSSGFILQGYGELECYYCEDCENPLNIDDDKLDFCPLLTGTTSNIVSTISEAPSTISQTPSTTSKVTTTIRVTSSTPPSTTTVRTTTPTSTVITTLENTSPTTTVSTTLENTSPSTIRTTTEGPPTHSDSSTTSVPHFSVTLDEPDKTTTESSPTTANHEEFEDENDERSSETATAPSTSNSHEEHSTTPSSRMAPKYAKNIFKEQSAFYKISNNYAERALKPSIRKNDPIYYCYTIQTKGNSTMKTQRGCIKVEPNEDACDNLRSNFGEIQNCRVCTNNKCNGSANLIISCTLILFSLIIGAMK